MKPFTDEELQTAYDKVGNPISFRPGFLAPEIAKRTDGEARGGSGGDVARRDLTRYYTVLNAELARSNLTDREAMFLVDLLNGTLIDETSYRFLFHEAEDAIQLDGLDGKWEIDGEQLVEKLKQASPATLMAIVDAVERFWTLVSDTRTAEGAGQDNLDLLRKVGLIRTSKAIAPTFTR